MTLAVLVVVLLSVALEAHDEVEKEYTNEWAVEIYGGQAVAELVAREHGYTVEELENIPDHYIFKRHELPLRSKRSADEFHRILTRDDRVIWAEQQDVKVRVKREAVDRQFNDPLWHIQWYSEELSHMWKRSMRTPRRKYTGQGVVVAILDDGLESGHPDISRNYDPHASYDFNDNDTNPQPRYDKSNSNRHGTRCAGEIAMQANNEICGVGVAYNARIGGIRMLDGIVTDGLEAKALSFRSSHISIKSSSWGPSDKGKVVEGMSKLAEKAIENGIKKGRGGKGVIYVWAAGNGGKFDTCACDGYASSPYTFSINSASHEHTAPYYIEKCASTIATAYSSGQNRDFMIVSTDLGGNCTTSHSGTSAAAPLAAGYIALALEANPSLTWRDVQHLIVVTSNSKLLKKTEGWYKNAVGHWVNLWFGFGLINATKLVDHAVTWEEVPKQLKCEVTASIGDARLKTNVTVVLTIDASTCGDDPETKIVYLEYIQVKVTLSAPHRGELEISVQSPGGTHTELLKKRPNDASDKGLQQWPFTSLHTWGEDPRGVWTVAITDSCTKENVTRGNVDNVTLVLYGTSQKPHMAFDQGDDVKHTEKPVASYTKKQQTKSGDRETNSNRAGELTARYRAFGLDRNLAAILADINRNDRGNNPRYVDDEYDYQRDVDYY